MHTPLNASAQTAGGLLSSSTFEVPPFQREYSWLDDEVGDFWNDLSANLEEPYFLGLLILTEAGGRKQVVDGQQRILSLTLLAAALHQEALKRGRKALADRIQMSLLRSINYETDETDPRVILSDAFDNSTLQSILDKGDVASGDIGNNDSLSKRMWKAFTFFHSKLEDDLASDPFKRLGAWTDFLTNRVYFAVFIHPDYAAAYKVFETINTRGRDLTTADLLKNYVLSQTPVPLREKRYAEWQHIAHHFSTTGNNSFVQYIRHVVTVEGGHILPKDLFDFLAQRVRYPSRRPPTPDRLMQLLSDHLPLYLQMIDPSLEGPAEPEALKIFGALNDLGVISVRPILLAVSAVPKSLDGMRYVLRLVVRRIVVGNLGTGNVERLFGEAATSVRETGDWHAAEAMLNDLLPPRRDFTDQLHKRSFNKGVLTFLRRSIIGNTMTPEDQGTMHFIMPPQSRWEAFTEEDANYWSVTIGNTFLSTLQRRPKVANSWAGFRQHLLLNPVKGEWVKELASLDDWNAETVDEMGKRLAEAAGNVWYG